MITRNPAFAALCLVALISGTIGSSVVAPGGSAVAASLAPGDTIYGISCDWDPASERQQLFVVEAPTATGFPIGVNPSGSNFFCALSTTWAGATEECVAYTVARDPDDSRALFRTDLTTGVSTFVSALVDGGGSVNTSSIAVDGAGAGWAIGRQGLFRIELTDGSAALVAALPIGGLGSLTWSPADGVFFARSANTVYRIDPVSLTVVPVFTASEVSGGAIHLIEGITVDSAGTVWISERERDLGLDPAEWTYALWSVSPGGTAERHGRIMVDGVKLGTAALLALPPTADCGQLPTLPFTEPGTPAPAALAATGSDSPVPLILLAGGVTVLGIGLLALASRRRGRCLRG